MRRFITREAEGPTRKGPLPEPPTPPRQVEKRDMERLQKVIARAGVASRRAAEEIILAGRVRVNGHVVTELGAKADPHKDKIEVDGKRLVSESLVYLVFHKPKNVVST